MLTKTLIIKDEQITNRLQDAVCSFCYTQVTQARKQFMSLYTGTRKLIIRIQEFRHERAEYNSYDLFYFTTKTF